MISAEQLAELRTSSTIGQPVWFLFKGKLFFDTGDRIQYLTTFKGFNVARRIDNIRIVSSEYVEFENEEQPIENDHVQFSMCDIHDEMYNYDHVIVPIDIPVNRDNYRAIESFKFIYSCWDHDVVNLSWNRIGSKHGIDGYIYSAVGFKTYNFHQAKTTFPKQNHKPPTSWRI